MPKTDAFAVPHACFYLGSAQCLRSCSNRSVLSRPPVQDFESTLPEIHRQAESKAELEAAEPASPRGGALSASDLDDDDDDLGPSAEAVVGGAIGRKASAAKRSDPDAIACSTASKGISLWQNGGGSASPAVNCGVEALS